MPRFHPDYEGCAVVRPGASCERPVNPKLRRGLASTCVYVLDQFPGFSATKFLARTCIFTSLLSRIQKNRYGPSSPAELSERYLSVTIKLLLIPEVCTDRFSVRSLVQVLRAIARVFWLWHGFGFGHVRATACVCRSMGEIPHEVYNRIANSNPPGMESARYFVRKQLFSLLRKLEGHGDHKFPGVIARRVCIAAFRDIGTFHRQFGRGPVRFELRITDQKRLNTFCSFQV